MAPPFCFDSEGTEKYRDRTQPPRGTGSKHLSMSSSDLPGPDDAARRKPAISRPVADGFLANPSDSLRGEHLLCDDCEGKQPDARPYAPKDRDRDEGEQADEIGRAKVWT